MILNLVVQRWPLAMIALLAVASAADVPRESYKLVTATTTASTIEFGWPARRITVVNDGAVSVHVDAFGTTATTADPEVKAGETYSVPEPSSAHDRRLSISIISASSTAAVRVYAYE